MNIPATYVSRGPSCIRFRSNVNWRTFSLSNDGGGLELAEILFDVPRPCASFGELRVIERTTDPERMKRIILEEVHRV